jgi:hypothetical protein
MQSGHQTLSRNQYAPILGKQPYYPDTPPGATVVSNHRRSVSGRRSCAPVSYSSDFERHGRGGWHDVESERPNAFDQSTERLLEDCAALLRPLFAEPLH